MLANKQQALIEHWKSEDARGEFIKDSVDEWMIELEKFVNKNYQAFLKDPTQVSKTFAKVLKTFALKYVNKHLELFEDAVESAEKLIEGIK